MNVSNLHCFASSVLNKVPCPPRQITWLALLLLCLPTAFAHGAEYQFTKVADETQGYSLGGGRNTFPSINNAGQVAFGGTNRALGSGAVHRWTDGVVEALYSAPDPDFVFPRSGVDINNAGSVAFLGQGNNIFKGDGGPLVAIADAGGQLSGFGLSVSYNDAGTVAFNAVVDTDGSGVFVGDGGPIETIATAPAGYLTNLPAINNLGEVAYQTMRDGDPHEARLHLFNGSESVLLRQTTNFLGEFVAVDRQPTGRVLRV